MILDLFAALDRAGVRYCLLHGFDQLSGKVTSDFDIAIAPGDIGIFSTVLRASKSLRVVQVLQHESTSFYIILASRNGKTVTYWPLDVEIDYRREGRIFLTSEELLAGRRSVDGVWLASRKAELSYLIAKKICKDSLPDPQGARLNQLVEVLGNEAHTTIQRLLGDKWGARTVDWIMEENWSAFEAWMSNLNRALRLQALRVDPFSLGRYWLMELKRIWIRLRYPTGLSVAILGPDGAGKSTLARAIEKQLAKAFRQTEARHLRPNLLKGNVVTEPLISPHSNMPRSWLVSVGKLLAFYLPDYTVGFFAQVWPGLIRSTLVLFDRYYVDILVDPRRYRYAGSMKLARFLLNLLPSPDLYLVLDASESVLLERKQEVSPTELARQRAGYRNLAGRLSNAILLDASLPADKIAHHAVDVLLGHMQDRIEYRRHLWFGTDFNETMNFLQSSLSLSSYWRTNSTDAGMNLDKAPDGVFSRFAILTLRDGRGYLLPLASRIAAARALSLYNAQSRRARLGRTLLAGSLRLGAGALLLPTMYLGARSRSNPNDENAISLLEHIGEVLGGSELAFGISLGTPGSHRKPVIQVQDMTGEVVAYAKVGWDNETNRLVENEASSLRSLGAEQFSFLVPQVIYAGKWNEQALCILTPPERAESDVEGYLTPGIVGTVIELARHRQRTIALKESSYWKHLMGRVGRVTSKFYLHVLLNGIKQVEDRVGESSLMFHLVHGDLAPWNVKRIDGQLFFLDWEYSQGEMPAGWDLFHFYFQTEWLLKRKSASETVHHLTSKSRLQAYWSDYLGSIGAEPMKLETLALLYLVERLSFHAVEPSVFQAHALRYATLVQLIDKGTSPALFSR